MPFLFEGNAVGKDETCPVCILVIGSVGILGHDLGVILPGKLYVSKVCNDMDFQVLGIRNRYLCLIGVEGSIAVCDGRLEGFDVGTFLEEAG